jgi:hypothetical protein
MSAETPAREGDLRAELQRRAEAAGLLMCADKPHEFVGEAESISAKWWFGGRKVAYRMSCRLDEADRTVHFREAIIERGWGIPPPTLTVETTAVSGWKRSGERHDVSLGGGGALDYGKARNAIEAACAAAGWTFHAEGGRLP